MKSVESAKSAKVPSGTFNGKMGKKGVLEGFDRIVPSGTLALLALLAVIVDSFRTERWNKYAG